MAKRTADVLIAKILVAIDALQVPQVIKDRIEWDTVPTLLTRNRSDLLMGYMVAISLPVPGLQDEYVMYTVPVEDPHLSQDDMNRAVAALYRQAQEEADQLSAGQRTLQNGHGELGGTTPGGLVIP